MAERANLVEHDYGRTGQHALLCPVCGQEWLHHYEVTPIWRKGEDTDATAYVTTRRGVEEKPIPNDEAPGRRSSIHITFWCEMCHHTGMVLEIMQHKGNTFLEWISTGERSEEPWDTPGGAL